MKKGFRGEGVVERVDFPNKGIVVTEDGERVIVKNSIPGQKVAFVVNKVKHGKAEGRLLEVLEKSPLETEEACPYFGQCGGCTYQTVAYDKQTDMKLVQVKKLIADAIGPEEETGYEFIGIKPSPLKEEYRNKMEFTFGDEYKDGPLALGMHKRGSFYDIVTVSQCRIIDRDFRTVLNTTLEYFKGTGLTYFHRLTHTGYLRHLLVRKATKTGEILVDLITTTQTEGFDEAAVLAGWKDALLAQSYAGSFKGILHTKNDSVADVVKNEGTEILYGQEFFYEELLGLHFKISPFSFFQTNSLGAEVLYETAREFIVDGDESRLNEMTVYDLYSGTGTIAQMMAPVCKEVVGVEIVEEAVEAAKENAKLNGLDNCKFLAGDVLRVLDTIEEKPDYIILDPPRDGIHPKAIEKIIAYGVENMVYISCKPSSLARDLEIFTARGYEVGKICCVDMFPNTVHVETVVLLSHKKADSYIHIDVEFGEGEGKIPVDSIAKRAEAYKPKEKVTYKMIKEYIEAKYGFKVHTAYIAEVKRNLGLPMYDAPNAVEELKQPRKHPTPEKVEAIKDALRYFAVI